MLACSAGLLPTFATIPIFWGLYRTLTNVTNDGLLTEGFYWVPSLSGPQGALQPLPMSLSSCTAPSHGGGLAPSRASECLMPSKVQAATGSSLWWTDSLPAGGVLHQGTWSSLCCWLSSNTSPPQSSPRRQMPTRCTPCLALLHPSCAAAIRDTACCEATLRPSS